MDLIELMASFVGIICVFIISYGLFLMKPHPEPIITEAKIVDKYTLPVDVTCHTLAYPGASMSLTPVIIQTFHIVVLSNKERRTMIRIGKEEYDTLEVDDPVEITEYSRIKKIMEKK